MPETLKRSEPLGESSSLGNAGKAIPAIGKMLTGEPTRKDILVSVNLLDAVTDAKF